MKLLILVLLITSLTLAQNYTGVFTLDDDSDTLTLTQHPDGNLTGEIISGDSVFGLQGKVSAQGALGTLTTGATSLAFGAIFIDEHTLHLQIAPLDANGQALIDQAFELNFIRQTSANPLTQTPLNPLTSNSTASPFDPNRIYQAHQTIASAQSGISIRVPGGYTATYHSQDGVLSFSDASQQRSFVVFGFSGGSVQALSSQVIELLKQENTQISIIGTPQETPDLVRVTLQVVNSQQAIVELAVRQGPAGNLLGIVGGSTRQDSQLIQAIDEVLASLAFSTPSSDVNIHLGGLDLSKTGSSSSFGSGIIPPSLTGVDEEFYTFCSSGNYGYSMSSQTFFSSDVGSFSSEDSDQHQGRWNVVSGMAGEPYLFLQATDGRSFIHPVATLAQGLAIGTSVFSANSSSQCQ